MAVGGPIAVSKKQPDRRDPDREYSVLLLKLNELIAQDMGDAAEADAIRDKMDSYWARMSPQQQQRVRWLTVDLETLSPEYPPATVRLAEASWLNEVNGEWDKLWAGDTEKALSLLRDPRASSPVSGGLIALKGRAWEAAGFPEVALRFLLAAESINPKTYSGLVIDLTRRLGEWKIATRKANDLLREHAIEPSSVYFACLALVESVRNEPIEVAEPVLARVRLRLEELLDRIPGTIFWTKEIHAGAVVILCSALKQLGRFSQAVEVYTQFLKLNPKEGDFYSMRASTKVSGSLGGEIEDYIQAVNNGTMWGWSYAAVAVSQIEQKRPAQALAICNIAMNKGLSPAESVAYLYQLRAVAQAYLNQSRERVVSDYREAHLLMPEDGTIQNALSRVEAATAETMKDVVHGDEPRLRGAVRAADYSRLADRFVDRVASSEGRSLAEVGRAL